METKENLLISFSGGETSAFMTWWLWTHKQDDYNMVVIFANTGQENIETLTFVEQFSNYFNIPVVWVEAKVNEYRKGTTFTLTDYSTADLTGAPFEAVIRKYGIPNVSAPHCTRELKERPIQSYAKSIGWKKYLTAIGIRLDEFDRVNAKHESLGLIYPLVSSAMQPMSKPMINLWWSQQPFRLRLKGYQGNCKTCWKKTENKLLAIAKENPKAFDFTKQMEAKYGMFTPESRLKLMAKRGELPKLPVRFYRENRSSEELLLMSRTFDKIVIDDTVERQERCEVFTGCK